MGYPIYQSAYTAAQIEAAIDKGPRVNSSGYWEVWNVETMAYESTGVGAGVKPPTVVTLASQMTNHGYVYIYEGSEDGYTPGYFYYWNGSAWTAGGAYRVAATDPTLSVAGAAADAKATGDAVGDLKSALTELAPTRLKSVDFEWTLGKNYDLTGYLANATGFATSGLYKVSPGNIIISTSPNQDANSKNITFDVNEFKSNGSVWLKRNRLTSGESFAVGSETTHIRFGFGYKNAESVTITQTLVDTYFSASVIEQAAAKSLVDAVSNTVAGKMDAPYYWEDSGETPIQGIIASDGTVYNPTASYDGRYISQHVDANARLLVSGVSNNPTYPCMYIAYDDSTSTTMLKGYTTTYADEPVTIPKAGTVYVSGNIINVPKIKTQEVIPPEAVAAVVVEVQADIDDMANLFAKIVDNKLFVKKRIAADKSICVSFTHHGANSLWDFSQIRYVNETPGEAMNTSTASNGTTLNVSDTDWFGPYIVQAVNNADGDVPGGNGYNTGGNHRSNNTAAGGGKTAEESSFAIIIDGQSITGDFECMTNEIVVKWTNLVQGNNTSKADGTGRAILSENWIMRITIDGISVENDICALEAIVLKRYYGTQAYFPTGGKVIYKGGNVRSPIAINSASTSGNKKCREAICYNANFRFAVGVEQVDLGSFDLDSAAYSMFTTQGVSKLYPNLIDGTVNANTDDHFFVRGYYKFW